MNAKLGAGVAAAVGLGGAVTVGEPNHTIRAVAAVGRGIRDTFEGWGDALLKLHGKQRTAHDHDVFVSHLGYSTTVYYFYNGLLLLQPVRLRLPLASPV